MSKIFFTSDNHFSHENILKKFCPDTRQGETVEQMDRLMIQRWQEQVQPEDVVYMLGDVFFCKVDRACSIMDQLPGHKYLVYGNHDKVIQQNSVLQNKFAGIDNYKELTIEGKKVMMFHFPMKEWNKMHHGSYHLFGHVHGGIPPYGRAMDVGIDTRPNNDMTLWRWNEIDALLSKGEILEHH